jgi:hypothetical protein
MDIIIINDNNKDSQCLDETLRVILSCYILKKNKGNIIPVRKVVRGDRK